MIRWYNVGVGKVIFRGSRISKTRNSSIGANFKILLTKQIANIKNRTIKIISAFDPGYWQKTTVLKHSLLTSADIKYYAKCISELYWPAMPNFKPAKHVQKIWQRSMYNQTLRLKNLRDSLYKHFFELRDRIAAKTTSICHPSYFCILMV